MLRKHVKHHCRRVDTAAGQLPDAFEMDERTTWDASDEVLQVVSGRQVCVSTVGTSRARA